MLKPRDIAIAGFIIFAALSRVVPHPWNVSPIAGMALFSGVQFRNKAAAFLFPLTALFLGDLILGLYPSMWVTYASFAAIVGIGFIVRKDPGVLSIACGALAASISFFLITNFGVWALDALYPKTAQGLWMCYAAALPFFQNTLRGDAFYVVLLFGGFALAEKWFPVLRDAPEAGLRSVA